MATTILEDRYYELLGEIAPDSPLAGLNPNIAATDDKAAMQALTTAFITAMYYSALANLFLQGKLPATLAEMEDERPRLKTAFIRSYAEYTVASEWLAQHGGEFIAASPAKFYYDEVQNMLDRDSIVDLETFYSKEEE